MSFKLVSQETIDIHRVNEWSTIDHHFVWSRAKKLSPGDIVLTKGSVSTDIELKSWDGADVAIKIKDHDNLQISWVKERPPFWYRLLSPGWETVGFRGRVEKEISGSDFMNLEFGKVDFYYQIQEYYLPEVFTPIDRLLIPFWEWSKVIGIEGIKDIERGTKLIYEPTLPSQARK